MKGKDLCLQNGLLPNVLIRNLGHCSCLFPRRWVSNTLLEIRHNSALNTIEITYLVFTFSLFNLLLPDIEVAVSGCFKKQNWVLPVYLVFSIFSTLNPKISDDFFQCFVWLFLTALVLAPHGAELIVIF